MKKYGKSTKRGFTLVELIVVLVILAVLAAMLVPALIGYINKAREEKEYQAASTVYTAVQALATEEYGQHGYKTGTSNIDVTKITVTDVETLTGLDNIDDIQIAVTGATVTAISVKFDGGEKYYNYEVGAKTWEADENTIGNVVAIS